MTVNILAVGSKELAKYLDSVPDITTTSIRMAINTISGGKGMTLIRREMTDEIAFPSGYLTADRLRLAKRATNQSLEATIIARKRATSLARFVTGGGAMIPGSKRHGVQVQVKKGRRTYMKDAWLVRLKQGASLTEDNYNVGLAVRVKQGERIVNKRDTHKSWLVRGKVALLYGPSVDQVFRDVSDKVSVPLADMIASEFHRNFERLSK